MRTNEAPAPFTSSRLRGLAVAVVVIPAARATCKTCRRIDELVSHIPIILSSDIGLRGELGGPNPLPGPALSDTSAVLKQVGSTLACAKLEWTGSFATGASLTAENC